MLPAILVTGGAGYIGSHTALLLAQLGYQIIIVDSFKHKQHFNPSWATVIEQDIGDRKALDALFATHNIKAVMHFAASIEVGESVKNPALFYENNVSNTIGLLQVMLNHGVNKIIFSSSCAVFGNPEGLTLHEEHPKRPLSPYGSTKYMVETILEDFHKAYGLEYVILRYFNAAGAWPEFGLGEQHEPETHIIPLLLRAALQRKPFTVFGTDYPTPDGTALRDYVHVRDIAQAHVLAFKHLEKGRPSDSFNLGTGNAISVKQMLEAVERVTHTQVPVVWGERRAGDPARLQAAPEKAHMILNWHPQYSEIDFILQSALAFHTNLPLKHEPMREILRS
ncbi:MAG: UDP-glucose 4-epimerase GalE [Candidatus Babeliales bacterium]